MDDKLYDILAYIIQKAANNPDKTLEQFKGESGKDGREPKRLKVRKGELIVYWSDGEITNAGLLPVEKGEKGDKGEKGEPGRDGVGFSGRNGLDGLNGKDGRFVKEINSNADGNLIFIMSDGAQIFVKLPESKTGGAKRWGGGGTTKVYVDAAIAAATVDLVHTIVAGTNISVDSTDPANPIVSVSGGLTGYVPYIGATSDVALGTHNLTGGSIVAGDSVVPASAILTATSTTQGFLPPRLTTAQKFDVPAPATGLVLYDTDLTSLSFYNGAAWKNNTGDVALAGQTYLTISGQTITAHSINLATTDCQGILPGSNGGTGINNIGKTITLGGSLTTSGAFNSTFTMVNTTSVTFPTSGTLATDSGVATTYVPYTGATSDVVLGLHRLTVGGSGTAPTNGLQVIGKVTLGTSSNVATNYLTVSATVSNSAGVYGLGLGLVGTLTNTVASGNLAMMQTGAWVAAVSSNATNAVASLELFNSLVTKTGAGTITSAFGIYSDGFSSIATNQWSAYFLSGSGGTINQALFSQNFMVGSTYDTINPPTNGGCIRGFLGIGTSAATNLLTIGTINTSSGELIAVNGTTAQSYMSFYNNTTRQGYIGTYTSGSGIILHSDTAGGITFDVTGSNPFYVYINSTLMSKLTTANYFVNGGLSIGTANFNNNAPSNGAIIDGDVYIGAISTQSTSAKLQTTNTGWNYSGTDGTAVGGIKINSATTSAPVMFGSYTNTKIGFFVNDGNASVIIDTSGRMAIGASTAAEKLDVSGAIRSLGALAGTTSASLSLDYGSVSSLSRILAFGTNNSTNGVLRFLSLRSDASNSVTMMSIDSNGVCVGGTYAASGTAPANGMLVQGKIYLNQSSLAANLTTAPLSISTATAKATAGASYGMIINTNDASSALELTLALYGSATAGLQGGYIEATVPGSSYNPLYIQPNGGGAAIGYTNSVAPPSNGLIVQSLVGLGVTSGLTDVLNINAATAAGFSGISLWNNGNLKWSIREDFADNNFKIGDTGAYQFIIGQTTGNLGLGISPTSQIQIYLNKALTGTSGSLTGLQIQSALGASSGTVGDAECIYLAPTFSNNAGTITQAAGMIIAAGTAGGTITSGYGLLINALAFGTTRYGLYVNKPSGGTAYTCYMDGVIGFGGAPLAYAALRVSGASNDACLYIDGTVNTNAGSLGYLVGTIVVPVLKPTANAACRGIYVTPQVDTTTSAVTTFRAVEIAPIAKTGSNALTDATSLYVVAPSGATNNYCAYFDHVGIAGQNAGGTHKLLVTGTAGLSTGTLWTNTSDIRIKKNIIDVEEALPIINKLRPRKFNYISEYNQAHKLNDVDLHYGYIADEVEEVLPSCVINSKEKLGNINNLKQLNLHNANILLLKAVQELSAKVTDLESRL